jgi:hypothetical protein
MGQQTSRGESNKKECGIVMSKYKGTGLVSLRKKLKEDERMDLLVSKLSPGDYEVLSHCLPGTFVDVEIVARIFSAVSTGDTNSLERIGYEIAKDGLKGMYNFLVHSFVSVGFMVGSAEVFWKVYNDTGTASFEPTGKYDGIFHVKFHPRLPEEIRHSVTGYFQYLLSEKLSVEVSHISTDPNDWRWMVKWLE